MKINLSIFLVLVFSFSIYNFNLNSAEGYEVNQIFPRTVKEETGRDYLTTPFPKPAATNTILCPIKPASENFNVYEAMGLCQTKSGATADKLPVFPFSSPIKSFVGRFIDGAGPSGDKISWFPFSGAENIKFVPSKNRIYMKEGNTLVAYKLDKFFSKIATEPLKFFFRKNPSGSNYYTEAMIPWDDYFYIGKRSESGWILYYPDTSNIMGNYDIDDRGFLYITSVSGWGIIRDDGTTLRPVSQMLVGHGKNEVVSGSRGSNKIFDVSSNEGEAGLIFSFKSGSSYYVATTNQNSINSILLWNVTDPYNPKYYRAENTELGYLPSLIKTKAGNKEIIALMHADTTVSGGSGGGKKMISIYNAEDFALGMGPKKTFELPDEAQGYTSMTATENGRIFAMAYGHGSEGKSKKEAGKMSLVVLNPTTGGDASSYKETIYDLGRYSTESSLTQSSFTPSATDFTAWKLSYDGGLLTARGYRWSQDEAGRDGKAPDIKMWNVQNGAPKEIDFKDYFLNRYEIPSEGYGVRAFYQIITNGQTYTTQGKTYLFVSTYGQGEVYEIDPTGSGAVVTNPDNGCASGNTYSTTSQPCACVLGQQFKRGDTGDAVKALQQILKDEGLYTGRVDGIYGPLSSAAAIAQCANKLNSGRVAPTSQGAPVIGEIGDKSLRMNYLGEWTVTATDPNKDDLSWSVDWGYGKSTQTCPTRPPLGTSKNWSYTFSNSWVAPGKYKVTVYASDCKGHTSQKSFNVTVVPGGSGFKDGPDDALNRDF